MEGYNKLTKDNMPKDKAIVTLWDGDRQVQGQWFIHGDEFGFSWIPRSHEGGICLRTNPTHWK